MKLGNATIRRTDFSTSRRGYERGEVDEHLEAIAAEVERLQARLDELSARPETLSEAANERLGRILAAAEASAAEVRAEAEAEARRLVEDAQRRTSELTGRADALDAEFDRVLERLRAAAAGAVDTLRAEAGAIRDELGAPAAPELDKPTEVVEPPIASEPLGDEAIPEPGGGEALPQPPDAGAVAGVDHDSDPDNEGARLIALNMALSGSSRDETADYLRETFGLEDPALLDDVYDRVQAS